jgi:hypothetical protein
MAKEVQINSVVLFHKHIVAECEALWEISSNIFWTPFLDSPIPWTVHQTASFTSHPRLKNLEKLHPRMENESGPDGGGVA